MATSSIPILVEETSGRARQRDLVRVGVPLPRGFLRDSAETQLSDAAGALVPHQARALAFWPDRSIQWLLVTALVSVSAHARSMLLLERSSEGDRGDGPLGVAVRARDNGFEIDTGPLRFGVGAGKPALITGVRLGELAIVAESGLQLRLTKDGRAHTAAIERVIVEEGGPQYASVRLEGGFTRSLGRPLEFVARVTGLAGSSRIEIELTLHNPQPARHAGGVWDLGDASSVLFQDLSLSMSPRGEAQGLRWYAQPADWNGGPLANWSLYQDSSGGENWNCNNHLTRQGAPSVRFPGYEVRSEGKVDGAGLRATPALAIESAHGVLAGTVIGFWQNFPKALRWEGGALSVALFPRESSAPFELQGGERKRHTVVLEFLSKGQPITLSHRQEPLIASVDPEWVAASGALDCFVPSSRDGNREYLDYIQTIIDGPSSFESKRELIDEYGWRNYGDLYADHEAVRQTGGKPFVSHYNNQYDFIYGAILQYLRSGDVRWWRLGSEAALHTLDIDIYHTDGDRPAFNHGLFWHTDHHKPALTSTHRTYSRKNGPRGTYGGGPSSEHNYTSGLLHYFYLTGDAAAAAAVRQLADWVIAMDDGDGSILGLIDSGPTGLASKTVDMDYHKAGRGPGNSINALLDAWRLSRDRRYMDKAEALIKRCIHPNDDIEALRLKEPEHRWSYLVFLQALAKYLDVKEEWGESDYAFYYARASLMHYAHWMMTSEVPYKDVLDKVELPTETWPAHDVRKSYVLHKAAKYVSPSERYAMHQRATFFFERSVRDVLSFETAYLTRPRVILCVYGATHAYFQAYPNEDEARACPDYDFGVPTVFRGQRQRLTDAVLIKLRLLFAAMGRVGAEAWSALASRAGD